MISKNEQRRIKELLSYEKKLWSQGLNYIAGVDEAGRGPLAGPVVAAAVIFRKEIFIPGINDSKKVSPRQREYLFQIIHSKAIAVGIGIVSEKKIDELNILQAAYKAMQLAIGDLATKPQHILVDGRKNPGFLLPQTAIIKGDSKSFTIAAASIIAKVTRDKIMIKYEKTYPQYGFAKHKGYPTRQHILALKQYGLCPIHRRTFKVKALTEL